MSNDQLGEFLRQQCKQRRLSLRRLSLNSGLSPATVHNIIKREYQPTLFSLNHLADYLGVRREYLWQLAGLLDDMDYRDEAELSDPRLKSQFLQADKLPEPDRTLVTDIVKPVIEHLQNNGKTAPEE